MALRVRVWVFGFWLHCFILTPTQMTNVACGHDLFHPDAHTHNERRMRARPTAGCIIELYRTACTSGAFCSAGCMQFDTGRQRNTS